MGNVVSLTISDLSALFCPRAGSAPVECNSPILSVFSVHHDEFRATFASLALSTWLAFLCCTLHSTGTQPVCFPRILAGPAEEFGGS